MSPIYVKTKIIISIIVSAFLFSSCYAQSEISKTDTIGYNTRINSYSQNSNNSSSDEDLLSEESGNSYENEWRTSRQNNHEDSGDVYVDDEDNVVNLNSYSSANISHNRNHNKFYAEISYAYVPRTSLFFDYDYLLTPGISIGWVYSYDYLYPNDIWGFSNIGLYYPYSPFNYYSPYYYPYNYYSPYYSSSYYYPYDYYSPYYYLPYTGGYYGNYYTPSKVRYRTNYKYRKHYRDKNNTVRRNSYVVNTSTKYRIGSRDRIGAVRNSEIRLARKSRNNVVRQNIRNNVRVNREKIANKSNRNKYVRKDRISIKKSGERIYSRNKNPNGKITKVRERTKFNGTTKRKTRDYRIKKYNPEHRVYSKPQINKGYKVKSRTRKIDKPAKSSETNYRSRNRTPRSSEKPRVEKRSRVPSSNKSYNRPRSSNRSHSFSKPSSGSNSSRSYTRPSGSSHVSRSYNKPSSRSSGRSSSGSSSRKRR